jgi:hypothetical protein
MTKPIIIAEGGAPTFEVTRVFPSILNTPRRLSAEDIITNIDLTLDNLSISADKSTKKHRHSSLDIDKHGDNSNKKRRLVSDEPAVAKEVIIIAHEEQKQPPVYESDALDFPMDSDHDNTDGNADCDDFDYEAFVDSTGLEFVPIPFSESSLQSDSPPPLPALENGDDNLNLDWDGIWADYFASDGISSISESTSESDQGRAIADDLSRHSSNNHKLLTSFMYEMYLEDCQ